MISHAPEQVWGATFTAMYDPDRPEALLDRHVRLSYQYGRLVADIAMGRAETADLLRLAPANEQAVQIPTRTTNIGSIAVTVENPWDIRVHRPPGTGINFISQPPLDALLELTKHHGIPWEYYSHDPEDSGTPDHFGSATIYEPLRVQLDGKMGLWVPSQGIVAAGLRAALAYEVSQWG
jgi:hypothetical protein